MSRLSKKRVKNLTKLIPKNDKRDRCKVCQRIIGGNNRRLLGRANKIERFTNYCEKCYPR